jgi:hypothetical protein
MIPQKPPVSPHYHPTAQWSRTCSLKQTPQCHGLRGGSRIGCPFGQDAVSLRNTIADLGHLQPTTSIKTNNSMAALITNNTIKQRQSKAMGIHFYWIRDRVEQGQFIIYWRPGEKISEITTSNSIPRHTTDSCAPPSYYRVLQAVYMPTPTAPASCEGMLIPAAPFAPLTTPCVHSRASTTDRHMYH